MHHYAKQLGSDCSFFISNRPSFVEGKGDQFESIQLDLSTYYIVLIYPNIHINTAKAYSGVSLDSFVKKITYQQLTKEGIQTIGAAIELMAEAEGLHAHKNAVTLRLQ